MKKHNPKCPFCGGLKTQKKGSRKGLKRYLCQLCKKSFSVDHREKPVLWTSHMDGVPFRKLADLNGISTAKAFSQVEAEMNQLPENTYLSANFCSRSRWSGILNIDGKYVKIKGYPKKIPFVYCIDFLTHDIPTGILAPSESYQVFLKAFSLSKNNQLSPPNCCLR
jgi:hypothetical protein